LLIAAPSTLSESNLHVARTSELCTMWILPIWKVPLLKKM
jgi:hypothetical protein